MSVRADPDKLRQLAKQLKSAGDQLEQVQRQALAALRSSGWEDRERQRFESSLTRDLKAASSVGRRLKSDYPKALEKKARALDDYRR